MLLSPNYLFSYTPGGKMLGPQKFFGRVIAKTARVNSLLLIEVHEEIYFWLDFEVIKEQVDIINIIVHLLRDLNPIHFWSNIAFGPLTSTDKNLDHKNKTKTGAEFLELNVSKSPLVNVAMIQPCPLCLLTIGIIDYGWLTVGSLHWSLDHRLRFLRVVPMLACRLFRNNFLSLYTAVLLEWMYRS